MSEDEDLESVVALGALPAPCPNKGASGAGSTESVPTDLWKGLSPRERMRQQKY